MLIRRIRYWLGQKGRAASLRAEMEQHLEETIAELREEGLSETAARAEARRRFGNFTSSQEASREVWIARYWAELWQDIRFGARTLIAQPGFSVPAILALVLGIGVNAVLFNVYNALALAPWAIRDPQGVVQVLSEAGRNRWGGMPWLQLRYLQKNTQSLAGLAAHTGADRAQISRGDLSWTASINLVSDNYFDLIGTGFALGRGFLRNPGDSYPSAPEIVLSHETWMTRFGGDREVLGTWLEVSGHQMQVIGVAAEGFNGPVAEAVQLWIPIGWRDNLHPGWDSLTNPGFCCVSVIGRLKTGFDRESAQAELSTLSAQFLQSVKREPVRIVATAPSFLANPGRVKQASGVFLAMAAATFLILALACANVANLQLARAIARSQEIAVRLSLGAGHGRIIRQLIVESLLISSVAGAASAILSTWLPKWTMRMIAGPEVRLVFQFENDWRVTAFIMSATCLATLLFGLAPALSAVREGMAVGLRNSGRTTSRNGMRPVLLGVQVALCAVLLSGTALLVRALDRVRNMDTGFRYNNVLALSTGLEGSGLDEKRAQALFALLQERVSALPGVHSIAWTATLPLGNSNNTISMRDPRTNEKFTAGNHQISANFFEVLNIPIVAGREFTKTDEGGSSAVIVSQATAEHLWPGESALGKTLDIGRPLEVVGVVRNFETKEFGSKLALGIWTPSKGDRSSRLLIRHSGDAAPLVIELPKRARELDRRLQITVAPYSDTIANARRVANVSASIAGVLGVLSLALACVGIYGVAAYNVSQRRREVGVRMALGAKPQAILSMILRQNLHAVAFGIAVGIAGAMAFGRLLTSLLYGVEPSDPVALSATIAILFGMAVLATLGPARRAAQVDPAIALRHD